MPRVGKGEKDIARARRIRRLRESRGLSGPMAAELVGVTYRGYQMWEEGKGIGPANLIKLSEVLGSSPEYVAFGESRTREIAELQHRLDALEREVRQALQQGGLRSGVLGKLDQLVGELRLLNGGVAQQPPLPADGSEDPSPPE